MVKRTSRRASHNQLLLTLAERLLASPFPGVPTQEVQILVGELPAHPPVQVPFPEGYKIIGSVLRSDHSIQIVLDADQPPEETIAFYRARLTAMGWQEAQWPMRPGGFGFGPDPRPVVFCASPRGPSLTVSAAQTSSASSDVRLYLQTDTRQSPCAMPSPRMRPPIPPIPDLRAPAGCKMRGGGGFGGGGNSWYTTISLQTAQDAAALVAHYDRQLEAAGWKKVDKVGTKSFASSTWRFNDAEGNAWAGVLVILNNVGTTEERFAYLHANLLA